MMTNPPSPTIPDADPVETAAAVATTMRRLVAETSALTDLDRAPQITAELLNVLREVAEVTTRLSHLAFEHPTPASRARTGLDVFGDRSDKPRAVNGFNDAAARIYVACQPLASAKNATTRLLDQTSPDITAAAGGNAPSRPGHHREPPDPLHTGRPHQSEPEHTPGL